jgi:hypothetical protein
MTYARVLAAVVMLAAVHALSVGAAVLWLGVVPAAFVLVWWLAWRLLICRRGVVLSWPTGGIAPARAPAWS